MLDWYDFRICIIQHFGMVNTKFNIIASQAEAIYKNTRSKLLKCCANIYFNKQCLVKQVIPKYAKVKFPNTSSSSQITTKKAQITRIKALNKSVYVFYCCTVHFDDSIIFTYHQAQ
jgi:ACR3 family arsenite efflux pump ArsB